MSVTFFFFPSFDPSLETTLIHADSKTQGKMVFALAWKVAAIALAKKATVYALGRVSTWSHNFL